jgi:hypothetical protein
LHTWDDHGRVLAVQLCRHDMRLSTHGAHGMTPAWFWVCPNVEHCGTVRGLSADEMLRVQQ